MKKHFYTHLIEVESLIVELDKLDLTKEEKLHLAQLADSQLHHTILDAVLSELPEQDKQEFISHLSAENHDKVWQLLNDKVDNIEEKIKKAAEDLKEEMKKEIKESKRLKNKAK